MDGVVDMDWGGMGVGGNMPYALKLRGSDRFRNSGWGGGGVLYPLPNVTWSRNSINPFWLKSIPIGEADCFQLCLCLFTS